MKKHIFAVLCMILLLSLTGYCGNMNNNALADKAQAIADTIVSDYGSISVQYAIIDKGSIILSGSSGVYDKIENRSVTKDDMYGIGSTSKMFVTAATMMLADKGLLDIDTPLTVYIPEFQMADERYKEITPRMLMNHSSGIYGSSFSNSFLFDDPDKTAHDTLLARLASQGLKADPGEMCDYCNDGFSL
ncbi:MAG TPA: serine hydrolase domain-containing protein, partial [Thermotogota bacterium]|nr:serine hydrolase domain-containing protein [Thermotogota bacterium]